MTPQTFQKYCKRILWTTFVLAFLMMLGNTLYQFVVSHTARIHAVLHQERIEIFSDVFKGYVEKNPSPTLPTLQDLNNSSNFILDEVHSPSNPDPYYEYQGLIYLAEGKPALWLTPDRVIAISIPPEFPKQPYLLAAYGDGTVKKIADDEKNHFLAELLLGFNPPRPRVPATQPVR